MERACTGYSGNDHRADIIRAYTPALGERQAAFEQMDRLRLEQVTGARLLELDLTEANAAVRKRLRDLSLAPGCLIISIRRAGVTILPRGETKFLAGDHVVALAAPGKEEMLQACLQ